jgi:hypothetical protein
MADIVERLRDKGIHFTEVTLCEEAADEIARLRAAALSSPPPVRDALRKALMWAFDRLSVDGGMNAPEQRHTMREIGKVLCGRPSPAASYKPNEWDDSAALPPPEGRGSIGAR